MKKKYASYIAGFVLLLSCTVSAPASDRIEYLQRSAARDASLFHSLDRNIDGKVTRAEARGDLNFEPRFGDLDIDRDDVVTTAELQRYLEQQYGKVR